MSQRVSMHQGDRAILEATIWSIGRQRRSGARRVRRRPTCLVRRISPERRPAAPRPTFAFWDNVEMKPVTLQRRVAAARGRCRPSGRRGAGSGPVATFEDDPWLDACRSVILARRPELARQLQHHAWKEPHGFIAPSLDLYVAFHCPAPEEPWLLADGYAPVSRGGLFGWTGRIWTTSGTLVASAAGQALYRRIPVPRIGAHTRRGAWLRSKWTTWDARFDVVAETLQKSHRSRDRRGSLRHGHVRGEPVVDIWGGYRDAAMSEPWESDTI